MSKLISTISLVTLLVIGSRISAQNVGVGEPNPGSTLSVKGALAVGGNYSVLKAPDGGAIIEGQIGVGTSKPDANALIELQSTSKGILLPRMTAAQRQAIQSPATGLLVFDTDDNSFYYYDGTASAWQKLSGTKTETATGKPAFVRTKINVTAGAVFNDLKIEGASYLKFIEKDRTDHFKLSGIEAGYDGEMIIIENDFNNHGTLLIETLSPAAATADRIFISAAGRYPTILAPGKAISLIYDATDARWVSVNWQN